MKTYNNDRVIKLLSIITIIMLTQSCSKDNNNSQSYNPKNYYFYLTAAQLNQTPYFTNKAFDTISFASDKGDTLTFVKTKTDTSWYCERTTSNPDNNEQNCYQTLHNTYTTIKGNGSFDVRHSKKGYYFGILPDLVEIKFNELYFLVRDFRIGSKAGGTFYDSLVRGNNIYKDVIDIYHNLNDSAFATAFVNKEFGTFSIKNNQTRVEFNYLSK